MPYGIDIIAKEYEAQKDKWNPEQNEKELARAAGAYLRLYLAETLGDRELALGHWPWDDGWNPKTPRDVLIKAGALIASELERING